MYETQHEIFEIGANGHQDLMVHVSESVFQSGMNTLATLEDGFDFADFYKVQYNEKLRRDSPIIRRVNKFISESGIREETI